MGRDVSVPEPSPTLGYDARRAIGPRNLPGRVIVCGGRNFMDWDRGYAELDRIHAERPIQIVIHGNARGADSMADCWARRRKIPCWPVPAEWSRYGKSAGPKRNAKMLGLKPQQVIAFPGGSGTRDMVKRARAAGVEVIEIA